MNPIEQASPAHKLARTDKWRANFALACALANEAVVEPKEEDPAVGAAARDAQASEAEHRLVSLLTELISARSASQTPEVDRKLAGSMLNPAVITLAGIWAVQSRQQPARMFISGSLNFLSDTGAPPGLPSDGHRSPDTALTAILEEGGRHHAAVMKWVGADYAISSPAAAYATCCYYAINAHKDKEDLQLALQLLTYAVTDPSQKLLAEHDPWLVPLRETSVWKAIWPEKKPAYRRPPLLAPDGDG